MLAQARPVTESGNQPATIEQLLAAARAGLRRLDPAQAAQAARAGARLVDIPQSQRRADGEIPGAIVIERNHLEWRLDPSSAGRIPEATDHDIAWIVLCDEGYSSSLAAASLQRLGLRNATDVIGGFHAWKAAGLPMSPQTTRPAPERSMTTGRNAHPGDRVAPTARNGPQARGRGTPSTPASRTAGIPGPPKPQRGGRRHLDQFSLTET